MFIKGILIQKKDSVKLDVSTLWACKKWRLFEQWINKKSQWKPGADVVINMSQEESFVNAKHAHTHTHTHSNSAFSSDPKHFVFTHNKSLNPSLWDAVAVKHLSTVYCHTRDKRNLHKNKHRLLGSERRAIKGCRVGKRLKSGLDLLAFSLICR